MYLDGDAFTLPLRLRNWRAGDHFSPLGMRGQRQKVQDFLTNNKVSKRQKQEILVLESQEGIVCIPGFRMAEWVRITAETKRALRITCDGLTLPMQATP